MRHIPSLDGLRGIAILMVIAFHYSHFAPFAYGWTGVDLFFVLSGYLITGKLLTTRQYPDYFTTFYHNRILRIFPLYFTTLLLFYLAIHFFTKPSTAPLLAYYLEHWKSYFLFTVNWTLIRHGLPAGAYLNHFWSLSIEEQFYLLWPLLIFCMRRTQNRLGWLAALFLCVLSARCICFAFYPHPAAAFFYYFNTIFRMDSFILGALLSQFHLEKKTMPVKLFGAIFIASGALLAGWGIFGDSSKPDHPFPVTIGYSVIAIFAGCLIHWATQTKSIVLNNKPLRFIGRISYGLYITHYLILQLFYSRFSGWYQARFPASGAPWFAALVCLLLTGILSSLSYYYLESPFLRLKKHPANAPLDTSYHSRY